MDLSEYILKKLELDNFLLIQDSILCMLEPDPSKRISSKECESKLYKLRSRTKKKHSSYLKQSFRNLKDEEKRRGSSPRQLQEMEEEEEIDEEEKKKKSNKAKRQSISVI
jgi:serine/threonine protein kinase